MSVKFIKCYITGNQRITNDVYLSKKSYQSSCSVEDFCKYYVTKKILTELRNYIKVHGLDAACTQYSIAEDVTNNILRVNGKTKRPE